MINHSTASNPGTCRGRAKRATDKVSASLKQGICIISLILFLPKNGHSLPFYWIF